MHTGSLLDGLSSRELGPFPLACPSAMPGKVVGEGKACYPAAHIPKEALMRISALAILTIVTVWTAAPARAQTYDPAYPVCLHVFRPWEYFQCAYTSLAQCAQSASGRAAMCDINPYPATARVPAERNYRRHRRVY
jgi:hypothetical protein